MYGEYGLPSYILPNNYKVKLTVHFLELREYIEIDSTNNFIKLSLYTAIAVSIVTIPINSEARFRGGSVEDHRV